MASEVIHNEPRQQFELTAQDHTCVAQYRVDGNLMIFTHTWVAPELRGQGIAGKLIQTALDFARGASKRVVPQCSYVDVFIKRHPEYADLL